MISTITATTVTAASSSSLVGTLALIPIITLLILLIQKEVAAMSTGPRAQALSQYLNVAFIPLILSFFLIALVGVARVLR